MTREDKAIDENMIHASELEEPLIVAVEKPLSREKPKTRVVASLVNILWGGSLVGMLSAFVGLYCLDAVVNLPTKASVVWYSFTWSLCTALLAYSLFHGSRAIFRLCQGSVSKTDVYIHNRVERFFCLGVFLGFCLTCTVHDAANGFPLVDIVITIFTASLWALLMVVWAVEGDEPVYSAELPLDVLV